MAIIRRYGDLPAVFVPDEGEVVIAARSPAGPYLRAAVTKVRRRLEGYVRVDFVWLEDAVTSPTGTGCRTGEKGHVDIHRQDPTPLIKRLPGQGGRD
jgi:hypothetical protein